MFWILLIIVVAVVAVVLWVRAQMQPTTTMQGQPPSTHASAQPRRQPDTNADWPPAVAEWVYRAREAAEQGDVDSARMCYQKAAYGFKELTSPQNEALKREIAGFTRTDPRYQAGLSLVQHAVQSAPGTLQSELGKSVGDQREALNYVLYFAGMTGDIVRVKSGRSYRLYLPTQAIPETSTRQTKGGK